MRWIFFVLLAGSGSAMPSRRNSRTRGSQSAVFFLLMAALGALACTSLRADKELGSTGGASGTTDLPLAGAAGEGGGAMASFDRLDCGPESPLPTSAPQIKPEEGPSCAGGLLCGDRSCCESRLVPGGTFPMGRSITGHDAVTSIDFGSTYLAEIPEHCATLDPFYLDTFEVTVGRFLRFVKSYNQWRADGFPVEDQGANLAVKPAPLLRTGWRSQFGAGLPDSEAAMSNSLACAPSSLLQTWSNAGTPDAEQLPLPISCVTWYLAFAFCVWDEGRLPTEAEWEFAAAGGAENRLYPWGQQAPDCSLANVGNCTNPPRHLSVGTTSGDGRFGQKDLGGNVAEWVLDWASYYPTHNGVPLPCDNCVFSDSGGIHMARGASDSPLGLRAAYRHDYAASNRVEMLGFRCARGPS